MFNLQNDIVKQILQQLSEIYPGALDDNEKLFVSKSLERKVVIQHLSYCIEKSWIAAVPGARNPDMSPKEYLGIKITAPGLDYLSTL